MARFRATVPSHAANAPPLKDCLSSGVAMRRENTSWMTVSRSSPARMWRVARSTVAKWLR